MRYLIVLLVLAPSLFVNADQYYATQDSYTTQNSYNTQGSGNTTDSGNFTSKVYNLPSSPPLSLVLSPPNGNSGWQAGITTIFGGFLFGRSKVDTSNKDLNQANADLMYMQGLSMIQQCYTPECNAYRNYVWSRFQYRQYR
jgi:hypothetical protein